MNLSQVSINLLEPECVMSNNNNHIKSIIFKYSS